MSPIGSPPLGSIAPRVNRPVSSMFMYDVCDVFRYHVYYVIGCILVGGCCKISSCCQYCQYLFQNLRLLGSVFIRVGSIGRGNPGSYRVRTGPTCTGVVPGYRVRIGSIERLLIWPPAPPFFSGFPTCSRCRPCASCSPRWDKTTRTPSSSTGSSCSPAVPAP